MDIIQKLYILLVSIASILVILISTGIIKIHCDIYRKQTITINE